MRLWHQDLISKLPRQQLLGQHRECAALRGKGRGKKHSVVDYVFNYSPYRLYKYHMLVMNEMENRGYKPDNKWRDPLYRGKAMEPYEMVVKIEISDMIYPEHDKAYLKECIENLEDKGVEIE